MRTLVISHIDPDGIFAAHLLRESLPGEVEVHFPQWHEYEIPVNIAVDKVDQVFVVDLGTNERKLLKENEWAKLGIKVFHLDHHPHNIWFLDERSIMSAVQGKSVDLHENLTFIHTTENCGTGLIYEFIRDNIGLPPTQADIWALIALYADVAVSSRGGQRILSVLREKYPSMMAHWYKEEMKIFQEGTEAWIPLPTMIGRIFNIPRKISFDKGPYVALEACREIDKLQNFDVLFNEDPRRDAAAPHASLLRNWERMFTSRMVDLIKGEKYDFLDFVTHGFVLLSFPWNISSDLARILSRRYKKGVTAINSGLEDVILFSGRNPDVCPAKWDLGIIYSELAYEQPQTFLSGGGHPDASAGSIKKGTPIMRIVDAMEAKFRQKKPRNTMVKT